jgi:hypothetical protein
LHHARQHAAPLADQRRPARTMLAMPTPASARAWTIRTGAAPLAGCTLGATTVPMVGTRRALCRRVLISMSVPLGISDEYIREQAGLRGRI